MSEGYIMPVPAPTTCRCRATDGMCHGWEGEVWWPVALSQAERAQRIGDGAMPSVMIDGRWLIVDCRSVAPSTHTEESG